MAAPAMPTSFGCTFYSRLIISAFSSVEDSSEFKHMQVAGADAVGRTILQNPARLSALCDALLQAFAYEKTGLLLSQEYKILLD